MQHFKSSFKDVKNRNEKGRLTEKMKRYPDERLK